MKRFFSILDELKLKVTFCDENKGEYSLEGMIDTGASITIIPHEVGENIRLKEHTKKEITMITGLANVKIPLRIVPVLMLGEITLKDVLVGIHELPDPAIKVLIGMNALKQLRTVIDGQERSFELEPQ